MEGIFPLLFLTLDHNTMTIDTQTLSKVSEVKLTYQPKVKASERAKITCSQDAHQILLPFYEEEMSYRESFKIILLARNNKALGVREVSTGGTSACIVDTKQIFQAAILANASGLILSHNHPSGERKPSSQDIQVTKKVKSIAEMLHMQVLDHLIMFEDGYTSMADEGYM